MESIAIHSHKGGVGKSTIALNLAVILSNEGKNVCLIDADFHAPNLHTFFDMDEEPNYLNEYFDNAVSMDSCLYDFSEKMGLTGKLLVGFSDPTSKSITRMLRLDGRTATKMLKRLMSIKSVIRKDPYNIDVLILDTTPGIGLTTINSFILTENILFIIKLSNADMDGTTHMVEGLLESLPNKSMMIANQIPPDKISTEEKRKDLNKLIMKDLRERSESDIEFLGWIAADTELLTIEFENAIKSIKGEASQRVIRTLDHPDHPFSTSLVEIRKKLFDI